MGFFQARVLEWRAIAFSEFWPIICQRQVNIVSTISDDTEQKILIQNEDNVLVPPAPPKSYEPVLKFTCSN